MIVYGTAKKPTDYTVVFNTDTSPLSYAWTTDLALDSQGRPYALFTARNGSAWQVAASVRRSGSRADALCAMLCDYRELMHSNTPVHEWPEP